ncbi:glycosyltransferase family 2 protein [Phormidesmis sp. 146-35]
MEKIAPKVFVLILNWNGQKDTIECLESASKIEYPNYETIIIDNGSIDDSVIVFKEKFPNIKLLETGANLGFSGGNNVGIEYALAHGADYVFLLNNDAIVDPQVLSTLVEAGEQNSKAGVLGSKIYFYKEPNKVWLGGGEWLSDQAEFNHIDYGKIDELKPELPPQEIDFACGCAFFMKAEVIKEIGLLEDKFFLMWEECDWCYRARRAGYTCLLVSASKVWHKISASFEGGNRSPHYEYFWWRNRFPWIERNAPSTIAALQFYAFAFRGIYRELRNYWNPQTIDRQRLAKKAALEGIKDYFLRRFGNCPEWVISAASQK